MLAIFVEWLSQGYTCRQQAEIWQLSTESLHRYRNIALNCFLQLYNQLVNFNVPDLAREGKINEPQFSAFRGKPLYRIRLKNY